MIILTFVAYFLFGSIWVESVSLTAIFFPVLFVLYPYWAFFEPELMTMPDDAEFGWFRKMLERDAMASTWLWSLQAKRYLNYNLNDDLQMLYAVHWALMPANAIPGIFLSTFGFPLVLFTILYL